MLNSQRGCLGDHILLLGGAKDKLFGLGLGVNIYGAGRSNVKNFDNTKNLEKYRPKVFASQTILVLWDYPDAGFR